MCVFLLLRPFGFDGRRLLCLLHCVGSGALSGILCFPYVEESATEENSCEQAGGFRVHFPLYRERGDERARLGLMPPRDIEIRTVVSSYSLSEEFRAAA